MKETLPCKEIMPGVFSVSAKGIEGKLVLSKEFANLMFYIYGTGISYALGGKIKLEQVQLEIEDEAVYILFNGQRRAVNFFGYGAGTKDCLYSFEHEEVYNSPLYQALI